MNIANINRPKLFSEYLGQKGAVNYIKSAIKNNKHPSGIIISGSPGLGKSSLAHLYSKATLCENRLEEEVEACGKCNSCLSDIEKGGHSNITYYRITEASVFKEAVNDLISMTKASPVITHDNIRKDNNRRFIIIDEVQSATKQSISPFLDSLEFAVEEVTVILISMDLDKMDHIVREAIESRCIELSLEKLNEEEISSKLQIVYEDLHPDSADLLAYLCKGNMRKAWRYIEFFDTQFSIEEITTNIISEGLLNGITKQKCIDLLDSLESKTWDDTKNILKIMSSSNEELILEYFLTVLIERDLNIQGIELLSMISFWLQSDYRIPLLSLYKQFQGKNLSAKIIKEDSYKPNYTVNKIFSNSNEVISSTKKVTSQLEKISGKNISIKIEKPAFLTFSNWVNILNHYDFN
jgi:DNA polymerase III gamma/tau subunit